MGGNASLPGSIIFLKKIKLLLQSSYPVNFNKMKVINTSFQTTTGSLFIINENEQNKASIQCIVEKNKKQIE